MDKCLVKLLLALAVVDRAACRMVDESGRNEHGDADGSERNGRKTYRWKSGNWGICFSGRGPNSCGQGARERPVRCVDSDGGTAPDFLCDAKREPERTRSCFTACRHHKDKLKWEVGPWGPCAESESNPAPAVVGKDPAEPMEQYGLMRRNVSCVLVSHDEAKLRLAVDEENCFTVARKPDPVRLCNIPTPQDCVVTEFTEWTPCRACHSGSEQTRIRSVIVAPKNGGKPCPELSETRPCPKEADCVGRSRGKARREFRLKISAWSKCDLPGAFVSGEEGDYRFGTHVDAGAIFPLMDVSVSAESSEKQTIFHARVGYQTREVVCKDGKGRIVDLSLCDATPEKLPARLRSCILPRDCVVSEWSAWTTVEEGCVEASGLVRPAIHERKRQVVGLPEGNGQPCPHLLEKKESADKESLPLCERKYKRILSKWSECIVTSGRESVKIGCGGGIQLRTVSCVIAASGRPVEEAHCSSAEEARELPTVQRCEVACPRDCVVGEWGRWGACYREGCSGNVTSAAPGFRLRKRTVLTQPSVEGVPCPAVAEVQPCGDVFCHRWSVGHWGMCVLDAPEAKCGPGSRTRSVKCLDSGKGVVDDGSCADGDKPAAEEPCSVPCPFDCVLSPWSDWSPCSHPCSGEKTTALRQRNRTIIAPPGPGGRSCPRPNELMEMEPCNTHGCHGYSWFALPWQPCLSEEDKVEGGNSILDLPPRASKAARLPETRPRNGSSGDASGGRTEGEDDEEDEPARFCGEGTRTREVWCMEDNNIRVADAKCSPLAKPPSAEACVKECPVDCRLSPWSEWSPCPQECVPDASNEVRDGEVAPTQTRSRVVLKNPSGGGRPCQHLDEFRPCPLSAARCKHYRWQLSDWSECRLPSGLKCGEGYRTRGVWCSRNQRLAKVSPTFCVENDGPPPALSESCTVDCLRHCVLSQWSPWSDCSSSCRGESVRSRTLVGSSASRAICLNSDFYPLRESKACPCELYTAEADDQWSDCILDHSLQKIVANGRLAHETCGTGTRYRRSVCANAAKDVVEASFCEMETSLVEEPCIVSCPVDCIQSEWSTWGECSALCGPGLHNRTRQVLQEPREGGRPCGANVEVKVCNAPCANYRWATSGYTQCSLNPRDEARGCGSGEQYRTVRCLDFGGRNGVAIQVRDEFCDPAKRPPALSSCRTFCPGECVVSPWSAWSECDETCSSTKQRQRTRVLLRSPAREDSDAKDCPHLIQVQSCKINVTCFTYEWRTTPYGSCLPLGGSPCGEGVQKRAVFCRRSDGRFVDDDLCDPKTKPAAAEKWCYVGCPIDCELSLWSEWDASECTCGDRSGFRYRRRKIVTSPSSSGRPCPSNLEQRKPCPAEPCYSWARGPWSGCLLEGAECGHGIARRNVSCLRGTVRVDASACFARGRAGSEAKRSEVELAALDLNTETSCYIPCRGDCEVSEWSSWSHCHRSCQDNPTGGYQTRSRAILKAASPEGEPCPTTLWETRPCNSGVCLRFEWRVEEGRILCRRSDGTPAVGGCDAKKKPCLSNCSLAKNAHCVAGTCVCLDGYRPSAAASSDSRPIECVAAREGISVNQKLAHPDTMTDGEDMLRSHLLYLPGDEFNIWMFAMIGIGCLFVVFVVVSFYLMCHNSNAASQENGTQAANASKP